MIKFCDGKYTAVQDKYQWVLTEHYMGKGRDGTDKAQVDKTYYATITQVCSKVLDREAGNCTSADEIIAAFAKAVDEMVIKYKNTVAK